jgi:hypothetical protein
MDLNILELFACRFRITRMFLLSLILYIYIYIYIMTYKYDKYFKYFQSNIKI